jgi:hypothetical protein
MKKVSKVNQVKAMLAKNPNLTAVEVAEAFKIKKPYAQTILWNAKGGTKKKRVAKVAKVAKANTVRQYSEDEVNRIVSLYQQDIHKLQTWVLERDNTITALKIDMLDQQAVINYLEKKLIK